eukprot:scaffold133416_cov84-Phaeocystis_antarctica.AAC.1
MDQVDGVRAVGQRRLDLVERCRHAVQWQPARAQRRKHALLSRRDHQVGRRDALGHRARVQWVLDAVLLHERRRARAEHRPRHRAHEARAAARQVNHHVALRVDKRTPEARRVARAHGQGVARGECRHRQGKRRRRSAVGLQRLRLVPRKCSRVDDALQPWVALELLAAAHDGSSAQHVHVRLVHVRVHS